jgi:DNA-binding NarL/FixJ family response regulator
VSPPIRVYVIDDHAVVREALRLGMANAPDMILVGEAATAAEARAAIASADPGVVLVDVGLPDGDGIELTAALRALVPRARLVILSAHEDALRVTEALRAGVHGYVSKTWRLDAILDAVRRAASGDSPLSAKAETAAMKALGPRGEVRGGLEALTERELEVLRLLGAGASTMEAGAALGISHKTVETHRARLYEKLGCESAIELARIALRHGLVRG